MRESLETFDFLPVSGEKIFTVTHRAAARRGTGGVLMLHPLVEEKLWVGRATTRLARALADAGLPVLRFDHRGHGDSDREHHEMTLDSLFEDLDAAAAAFRAREGVEELHLFGFRHGGTLALHRAGSLGASSVAAVGPPASGADSLMKMLRSNLTTQMGIFGEVREDREALLAHMRETGLLNLDGYHLSAELYDGLAGIDLAAGLDYAGPALVVSLLRREGAQADADSRRVHAAVAGHPASRLETVPGPPVWGEQKRFDIGDEALFAPLLDWFGGGWRGEAAQ